MEEKILSCGFLVEYNGKYLACHASGRKFENGTYDIAKGQNETGEDHLATAKRELKEETGIDIDNADFGYNIIDYGVQDYLKTKNLHVYGLKIKELNKELDLKCSTYFENQNGQQVPEVNGYLWTDDFSVYFKSLQRVLNRLKDSGQLI